MAGVQLQGGAPIEAEGIGERIGPSLVQEEAKTFQDSNRVEREAWIKNGVVQQLTPQEASRVPASAIFKIPRRVVGVNKVLQAKSRVAIPGHMDPGMESPGVTGRQRHQQPPGS